MLTDSGKFWAKVGLLTIIHLIVVCGLTVYFLSLTDVLILIVIMILIDIQSELIHYFRHQLIISELLNMRGVDAVAILKTGLIWWYRSPHYHVFCKDNSSGFDMEELLDIESKFNINTTARQHQGRAIESIVNGWKIYRK